MLARDVRSCGSRRHYLVCEGDELSVRIGLLLTVLEGQSCRLAGILFSKYSLGLKKADSEGAG